MIIIHMRIVIIIIIASIVATVQSDTLEINYEDYLGQFYIAMHLYMWLELDKTSIIDCILRH